MTSANLRAGPERRGDPVLALLNLALAAVVGILSLRAGQIFLAARQGGEIHGGAWSLMLLGLVAPAGFLFFVAALGFWQGWKSRWWWQLAPFVVPFLIVAFVLLLV